MIYGYHITTRKEDLVYLYLEIDNERFFTRETNILKQYVNAKYGYTILLGKIMLRNMNLIALHYMLQRLFGWFNKYLFSIRLPDKAIDFFTEDDTYKLFISFLNPLTGDFEDKLCILCKNPYPNIADEEDFIRIGDWLSNKCTMGGKYQYDMIMVDYMSNDIIPNNREEDEKTCKNLNRLLEKLKVSLVLAHEGYDFRNNFFYLFYRLLVEYVRLKKRDSNNEMQPNIIPIAYELIYEYDFNQKWRVNITMPKDRSELVKNNSAPYEKIEEAKGKVRESYRPYCIYKDGVNVMDYILNLPGFCCFLSMIFEDDEFEKRRNAKFSRRSDGYVDEIGDSAVF